MYLRYSSSVVAPTQCSSPRASAGLSMLPASIAPSALPAPTMVCSSSMKTMVSPSSCASSFSTAFSRSSNSPRYFAPASSAAMSSDSTRLFFSVSGTSPLTMRCARPSTIAVLPTPGSPISTGLFLVRRCRIWMHAPDLVVAPDHRVELAGPRALGQIEGVLLERLALCPRPRGPRPTRRRAASLIACSSALRVAAGLLEEPPDLALVLGQGEQEQLRRDVLVAALLRFLVGDVEQVARARGRSGPRRRALDLRQAVDEALQALAEPGDVDPGLGEEATQCRRPPG